MQTLIGSNIWALMDTSLCLYKIKSRYPSHEAILFSCSSFAAIILHRLCSSKHTDTHVPCLQLRPPPRNPPLARFESGEYRNLFKEYLGKSDEDIQARLDAAWNQLFYGDDDFERIYYPVGEDMAYIKDIGNGDVRTEGMSYGMMIAVQLDKQEEFDRLWKWAKTYMYQSDGPYQGYFAWHCSPDGEKLDSNPASDGEEWFATALLFASDRWGNGRESSIIKPRRRRSWMRCSTRRIRKSDLATNMFNLEHKQVVFVPKIGRDSSFTDPSYHLPAYYELWSRAANQDQDFWKQAAQTSRDILQKICQPANRIDA